MMTLYEQNPAAWDKLADQGKPSLREMAKLFHRPYEIDKALGINSAAAHWHSGRNGASKGSEYIAKKWIEENTETFVPSPEPKVETKTSSVTLLCVADVATAAKAEKVLRLLGCEVVEV